MKSGWRIFFWGVGVGVAGLILALLFLAYQSPDLLLDWANLRYCG